MTDRADDLPPLDSDDDSDGQTETAEGKRNPFANPNPGHCRTCGVELEDKRKQYCAEHRDDVKGRHSRRQAAPSSESRAGRAAPSGGDKFSRLTADLTDQLVIAGLMVQMPLPVTGKHVERRAGKIATDMVAVARRNKNVYQALTKAADGLVFLALAEDALGIGLALRVDMGANPHTAAAKALGVTTSYSQSLDERGLPDPWPAYLEARRAEAEARRDEAVREAAAAKAAQQQQGAA